MIEKYILNNESPYFDIVLKCVQSIENQYSIDIYFAGITNSLAIGINNGLSDIDLFMVYEGAALLPVDILQKFNSAILVETVEVKLIPIEMIYSDRMGGGIAGVDVAWGRKRRLWDYEELPGEINIEHSTLLTQMVFNRMLFDVNNYCQKNEKELVTRLNMYDFVKRCYIWAKGRLNNYLRDDNVRIRTYLYAIYEVLLAEWILKNRTYPNPSFLSLINELIGIELKDEILNLYRINNTTSLCKEKLLIPRKIEINNWLEVHLKELKPKIIELYAKNNSKTFEIG